MNADLKSPETKETFTAESLPDHPLFRGLSEQHRQIFAQCSARASLSAGQKLVESGESTNYFYLVIRGSLGLESHGGRAPSPVQNIRSGGILGWSWLFPPDCWQFDAIAEEATEVISFDASRLCQECNRDNSLGYELFKRMARRYHGSAAMHPTVERVTTTLYPRMTDSGKISLPSLRRGNPNAFEFNGSRGKTLQRDHDQSPNAWPQALLNTAKMAIKSVSSAGKSIITGDPFAMMPPATQPQVPSSQHEG